MRYTLVLFVLALIPLGSRADDKKTDPLKVENEKGKETTFTAEAIAKLPRQTLKVKDHKGNPATYEGVLLADVLRSAGVTLGKDLKGPLLANYLLVEAADGYRVVFALPGSRSRADR